MQPVNEDYLLSRCSFVPTKLLDYYPAGVSAKHPTEKRFCKVTITRYMHQIEKERKDNKSNRQKQLDGEKYTTWQYMPRFILELYQKTGDPFFIE